MEQTSQRITVETRVNAPIERVWEFWTAPEHIQDWYSASPDWHTPRASNDVRVGGEFHFFMAPKATGEGFDFSGVYTAVVPNESLSYTIPDGRCVDVTFTVDQGVVVVREVFDPEQVNPVEMQRAGWQAILDHFRETVEVSL